MQILAIILAVFGALPLVIGLLMLLTGDNSDNRAMGWIPIYVSLAPLGLAVICQIIHWL